MRCSPVFFVLLATGCGSPSSEPTAPLHASSPSSATPSEAGAITTSCDVGGDRVPFERLDVPGCPALASDFGYGGTRDDRGIPEGIDVVASADEFRERFDCEPPAFDFASRRLAVFRFKRPTPDSYALPSVRALHDRLTLVVEVTHLCQGRPPMIHRGTIVAAVPLAPARVDVAICREQTRCPPLP